MIYSCHHWHGDQPEGTSEAPKRRSEETALNSAYSQTTEGLLTLPGTFNAGASGCLQVMLGCQELKSQLPLRAGAVGGFGGATFPFCLQEDEGVCLRSLLLLTWHLPTTL